MSIKTEIIADSLNPQGDRLTTFILEYPRFINSEIMTHRVFSRNAASSRAIPVNKIIQAVKDNPAMPVWWGKNQSGMQAQEELDNENCYDAECDLSENGEHLDTTVPVTKKEKARRVWMSARNLAIQQALQLQEIGLHKQIANRILEPWFNMKIILSGTEFENFFALRAHPDAQPEFQELAHKMLEEYNNNEPKRLKAGKWHIPFGEKIDYEKLQNLKEVGFGDGLTFEDLKMKIAVARCARVSYLNYEGKDDYEADIKLCDRLFSSVPKHLSPTEHVARAEDHSNFIGNFKGFLQYRKTQENENLKDARVKKFN